jgi:hypothetical protein
MLLDRGGDRLVLMIVLPFHFLEFRNQNSTTNPAILVCALDLLR